MFPPRDRSFSKILKDRIASIMSATCIPRSKTNKDQLTTRAVVGDAVAKTLLRPATTQNHYICVSSFTTKQNKILTTLERLSRGPWKIKKVITKAKIEEANEAFKNGGDVAEALSDFGAFKHGRDWQ